MRDVTVIGGGIVGLASAIALQDDGHAVEIIERERPGAGATFGNCGLLAVGEVVPISKPGVVRKIPGWLRDPEGPLFVRPRALVRELPWLLRFLWAGRPRRVVEAARILASLTRHAEADYRALLGRAGLSDNLVPAENLIVFHSRDDYERDRFTWDLRSSLGFSHAFLTGGEVRALEPALGGPITCGALLTGWHQFSDPFMMAQRLAAYFQARGGVIRMSAVEGIETAAGKASAVRLADGERLPVRRVVLAAGAWSRPLARGLGLRVPLAALQGYHHHVLAPGVSLGRPVLYGNGGFVVTPMETGLRIAGTIEVAGADPRPNLARADIIARKAAQILPGLDLSGGTQWMGPRPFMPDSLPVLGAAPGHSNVVLAYGHGQVGVTLAATTGRIVADLVAGRTPPVDLAPFRPDRFR
ncbi:NAD(P)/FAD-dependent oxidoreductase [Chelatococcus sp. GCM10030263]|uniref:NAD(P)/FAD-dependent oxidoreductase n=1 Tax=Chelatococcus sp. GCM10030263 TaxID=3273387 RepID=UPI00361801E4